MASLKNLQVDAKATQKDITTSGKLGDRNVGVKVNLNASLPEGYSARLTVTDKTASDVRARARGAARPRCRVLPHIGGQPFCCSQRLAPRRALTRARAPRTSWPRT